jgi:uncharacterized protein (DUF885 family)
MRIFLASCLALSSMAVSAQAQPSTVATRLASQNALFDDWYEAGLKASPERATAFGDYRYNDRLNDVSLAEVARREKENEAYLARLKAISTDGFAEQDVLSHELMQRSLEQGVANYNFKEYEMPVSQMDGPARCADEWVDRSAEGEMRGPSLIRYE